jgi:hypothetical protein
MSLQKFYLSLFVFGISACSDRNGSGSPEDQESFDKTEALILEGFQRRCKGCAGIASSGCCKIFRGKNIVKEQKV